MKSCLVIGGGVIGLSLAYELLRRQWRVTLLERGHLGREASWAGAGILPPANSATALHPLDKLRALSHELHAEWAVRLLAETGIDNGYRRCGGVTWLALRAKRRRWPAWPRLSARSRLSAAASRTAN